MLTQPGHWGILGDGGIWDSVHTTADAKVQKMLHAHAPKIVIFFFHLLLPPSKELDNMELPLKDAC